MARFSPYLLDRALARAREEREQRRKGRLTAVFQALERLSRLIPFEEAYIFGSLTKPYRYFADSDVDIAFIGLRDEDFFRAMAFLSRELGTEVDILQLEGHPLRDKVVKEGIRWKRSD
ncbi:nucleotidyltransferase family protein [Thermodesulforhabdus norvegica]|uniref:Polymerase beta nucleotidyltransferase domain-containing protein n=1 Tax=Thermodesulforhabdus norvegica TaxID=39841 RepID=A0A1I4TVZ3_9BACT|nr:nucleotidyltransferase domain-containing protein [Thermodesulforhabdus norvegica]SFM80829.1 hypothetical protein SAMN05660836_01550 [Thermodesulforhabdus norvegica]